MANAGNMRNSMPTSPASADTAEATVDAATGHTSAKSTTTSHAHSSATASSGGKHDVDPTGLAGSTSRQAADLAKSLGRSGNAKISIAVTDQTDTLISRPASTLVAAAAVAGQKGNSRQGQASTTGKGKAGLESIVASSSRTAAAAPQIQQTPAQANAPANNFQSLLQGATGTGTSGQSKGAGILAPNANADPVGLGSPNLPAHGSQVALGRTAGMSKPHPTHPPTTEQISVQITKAVKSGIDKIDIQLRPESLGRVEVRLELAGDGRLVGTVTADNRETLELLKTDARDLERALQDAGLKADSNSLNFNLRGQGNRSFGGDGSGSPERTTMQNSVHTEHEDRIPVRTLDGYSSGMISPDGSVNITT
jgi:flagellar hook-length control protein FliK